MTLLNDTQITYLARQGMITPFVDHQVEVNGLSKGLGPSGYDICTTSEWMVARADGGHDHYNQDVLELPPGGCVLACSLETFALPDNVVGTCVGKSTLARKFIHVLMTPLEAGWPGQLTLEIINLSPAPFKLFAGMPIAQIRFEMLDGGRPENPYNGKYTGQVGVQVALGGDA